MSERTPRSHSGLPVKFSLAPLAADFDPGRVYVEPVEPVDSRYGRFGGRCFALRGVLSPAECEYLIDQMVGTGPVEAVNYRDDYRKNDRCVYDSPELARLLYSRLEHVVRDLELVVDPAEPAAQRLHGAAEAEVEAEVEAAALDRDGASEPCPEPLRLPFTRGGRWRAAGLNECLRFCRYSSGGFFRAHCDGTFVRSEEELSLFTCMFYLDGGFVGGTTRFLQLQGALRDDRHLEAADDSSVLAEVVPEPGLCLLFFQPGLLHEGTELLEGCKHILRTDVMFRRDPASRPQSTAQEQEAWDAAQAAAAAEAAGDCERACQLYRRAFKLDPRLERLF